MHFYASVHTHMYKLDLAKIDEWDYTRTRAAWHNGRWIFRAFHYIKKY